MMVPGFEKSYCSCQQVLMLSTLRLNESNPDLEVAFRLVDLEADADITLVGLLRVGEGLPAGVVSLDCSVIYVIEM